MSKKAIIYGAGNIGRGFIGQLFSQSGYEVVFIDVDSTIVDLLNAERQYPIRFASNNGNIEIKIKNVRAVNGMDQNLVIEEISTADLLATAVGVHVLPKIAENIAKGLCLRWDTIGDRPLDLIICENLISADKYLKDLVQRYLSEEEKIKLNRNIGFVEASIGRMVPVSTPEMQEGNRLRVCVEWYDKLPVDRNGFKGSIPDIEGLIPYSPFDFYIQRKLYIHNLGHAITAYLGHIHGYKYIWEAIEDPSIVSIVRGAMEESARALSMEHNISYDELQEHVDDLLERFGNRQLGDTVERVGKDIIRKLSPHDRLIGALLLCKKHGVLPVYIERGIAAAFDFNENAQSEILTYFESHKIELVLQYICGLSPDSIEYHDILEITKN